MDVRVVDERPATGVVVAGVVRSTDPAGPSPIIERRPTDVERTPRPRHPCAGEHPAGHPTPSATGHELPVAVVVGRPTPGFVRHPEIAAGTIGPVAVGVGTPVVGDARWRPDGSVVRHRRPGSVPRQFRVVRLHLVRHGVPAIALVRRVTIVRAIGVVARIAPAIESVRGERAVGRRLVGSRPQAGHRTHAAANQHGSVVADNLRHAAKRRHARSVPPVGVDAEFALAQQVNRSVVRIDPELFLVRQARTDPKYAVVQSEHRIVLVFGAGVRQRLEYDRSIAIDPHDRAAGQLDLEPLIAVGANGITREDRGVDAGALRFAPLGIGSHDRWVPICGADAAVRPGLVPVAVSVGVGCLRKRRCGEPQGQQDRCCGRDRAMSGGHAVLLRAFARGRPVPLHRACHARSAENKKPRRDFRGGWGFWPAVERGRPRPLLRTVALTLVRSRC